MDKEGIELVDFYALGEACLYRVGFMVGLVKMVVESSEESAHSNIHFSMGIGDGWVYKDGLLCVGAEEISGPKVSMSEGCGFGGANFIEVVAEGIEVFEVSFIEVFLVECNFGLRKESLVGVELTPCFMTLVGLRKGADIVLMVKSKVGFRLLV